jgi:protein-L-isoaspartate(D-aspartate) O-methyltransferase
MPEPLSETELAARQRRHMIDGQIRTYDVNDAALIDVLAALPREVFLPATLRPLAYTDFPLNAGGTEERQYLVPMVLARLIQAAEVRPGMRVLDVAGGTGYSAVILAKLGAQVTALESDPELAKQALANFEALGVPGVVGVVGPLAAGHEPGAPFEVIFINGAFEARPEPLLAQLRDGGRLLGVEMSIPNRPARTAKATLFLRAGNSISSRPIFDACAPVLAAFRKTPEFVF